MNNSELKDLSRLNIGNVPFKIKGSGNESSTISDITIDTSDGGVTIQTTLGDGTEGPSATLPLAGEDSAGLMSSEDKEKLNTLVATSAGGMHFIGTTSTVLYNGSTASTLVAASADSLLKSTGFINGDVVVYQNKEFAYCSGKWVELGDQSAISTLQTQMASANSSISALDSKVESY
uniref:Uncharacterized protein n=1 Tax=Dulem virus 42 TaxID=3145760 RepID=A0AAU8B7M5_9CAUD